MSVVAIASITIGSNRRPIRQERIGELMESIRANGLLNPITLDQNHTLVAGLHRLTACKLLGFQEIECRILSCSDEDHTRLAEIDENLIRTELDPLDRSELWLERDQILDRMGLRARVGDNQHSRRGGEIVSPRPKTTLELANETGYTDRTFQLGKQIARNISPEVKAQIRGTAIAKSTTTLLKVARAGNEERMQAEQAEQAAQKVGQKSMEFAQYQEAALAARKRQRDLQLAALQTATAEKDAKGISKKKGSPSTSSSSKAPIEASATPTLGVKFNEEWMLGNHLVYCGDTSSPEFVVQLPSDAALAIATPSHAWQHDYLINEARIVAVICREDEVYRFQRQHQMPFQYEFLLGNLYLAVFSHQPLVKPQRPTSVQGIESAIAYLVSLYTKTGSFVIGSALGHGELLIACERLGRICFVGDPNPVCVEDAIDRWQKLTRKTAKKAS